MIRGPWSCVLEPCGLDQVTPETHSTQSVFLTLLKLIATLAQHQLYNQIEGAMKHETFRIIMVAN
jgi:hypothetical protein